jgi:hypothetical protein
MLHIISHHIHITRPPAPPPDVYMYYTYITYLSYHPSHEYLQTCYGTRMYVCTVCMHPHLLALLDIREGLCPLEHKNGKFNIFLISIICLNAKYQSTRITQFVQNTCSTYIHTYIETYINLLLSYTYIHVYVHNN